MMSFGNNLREARKRASKTQENLAEELEVSRQSVSKWENGDGYPETEKLIQLSKLLNVSLDLLFADELIEDNTPEADTQQLPPGIVAGLETFAAALENLHLTNGGK